MLWKYNEVSYYYRYVSYYNCDIKMISILINNVISRPPNNIFLNIISSPKSHRWHLEGLEMSNIDLRMKNNKVRKFWTIFLQLACARVRHTLHPFSQ